jgi:hypothetical protein
LEFHVAGFAGGVLMRLARVYDQDHHSLSLLTLLHAIAQHTHFFEDDAVLRRVSQAYAAEFKAGSHQIDLERLNADIELVWASDPLVKKVIVWRSNFGAHLSTKPILRDGIRGHNPLTEDDVFALVDRAFDVFNRYLVAFEGASFSKKIIGEDDHQFLLKLLRLGLEKFEADVDKALR